MGAMDNGAMRKARNVGAAIAALLLGTSISATTILGANGATVGPVDNILNAVQFDSRQSAVGAHVHTASRVICYRVFGNGPAILLEYVVSSGTASGSDAEQVLAGTVQFAGGKMGTLVKGSRLNAKALGYRDDWNGATGGSATGTDNTAVINAAVALQSTRGGGEVLLDGRALAVGPILPKSNVRIVSTSTIQGGYDALYITGNYVFRIDGFTCLFNLEKCNIRGERGTTQFCELLNGGAFGWGTVTGCYFVNIKYFDFLSTGPHIINNNFQNTFKLSIRGSDCTFQQNYVNYDDTLGDAVSTDALVLIAAASAIDFTHNYLTSYKASGTAPRTLVIDNCQMIRATDNQCDGGTDHNVCIQNGSYRIDCSNNRMGKYQSNTPFLLSNVTGVTAERNKIPGLATSEGWYKIVSNASRIVLRDNDPAANASDSSQHWYAVSTDNADVRVTQENLKVIHRTADLTLQPPLYQRIFTNKGATGLVRLYIRKSGFRAGDWIIVNRLAAQRLIVQDQDSGPLNIYDSDTAPGYDKFKVIAYEDGVIGIEVIS